MDGAGGHAIYHSQDCSIGFRLASSSSVFTDELIAVSIDLIYISFEIPGEYVILTNSLSSIRAMENRKISLHTHPIVYECKQKTWELGR
jgi:hypothetical protein